MSSKRAAAPAGKAHLVVVSVPGLSYSFEHAVDVHQVQLVSAEAHGICIAPVPCQHACEAADQ
jgi:hypothetical protein